MSGFGTCLIKKRNHPPSIERTSLRLPSTWPLLPDAVAGACSRGCEATQPSSSEARRLAHLVSLVRRARLACMLSPDSTPKTPERRVTACLERIPPQTDYDARGGAGGQWVEKRHATHDVGNGTGLLALSLEPHSIAPNRSPNRNPHTHTRRSLDRTGRGDPFAASKSPEARSRKYSHLPQDPCSADRSRVGRLAMPPADVLD